MRAVLVCAACVALGTGCTDSFALAVDLRTDWLPVREFQIVRTVVWRDESPSEQLGPFDLAVTPESSFLPRSSLPARRIAELEEIEEGDISLRVSLVETDGAETTPIGAQEAHVRLANDSVVGISILRACATADGVCVGTECTADADCDPPRDCARAVCDQGECFAEPIEGACSDGTYCHPVWGCAPVTCDPSAPSSCGTTGLLCTPEGRCECPGGSLERLCTDGLDNDCDGAIDCADWSCADVRCGAFGYRCMDGACRCEENGVCNDATTPWMRCCGGECVNTHGLDHCGGCFQACRGPSEVPGECYTFAPGKAACRCGASLGGLANCPNDGAWECILLDRGPSVCSCRGDPMCAPTQHCGSPSGAAGGRYCEY